MNNDVIYVIASFCDLKTCVRWSQVSKYWNKRLDEAFWCAKSKSFIKIPPNENWIIDEILKSRSWLWIIRSCIFNNSPDVMIKNGSWLWIMFNNPSLQYFFTKKDQPIVGRVSKRESIYYNGELIGTTEHGFGVTHTSKSIYVGEYVHGVVHGFGVLNVKNRYIYSGEWVNGMQCGKGKAIWTGDDQYGTEKVVWIGYSEYVGEFECGTMHGIGTLLMYNGLKYVGMMQHGRISGDGTLFFKDSLGNEKISKGTWKSIVVDYDTWDCELYLKSGITFIKHEIVVKVLPSSYYLYLLFIN